MRDFSPVFAAALLSGCTWFGPGHVFADKDAPFQIGKLKTALLLTEETTRRWGNYGTGVLFLADTKHECDDIEQFDGDADLYDGNGMVFLLDYQADDDVDDPWEGIWTEGYSYSGIDDVERRMAAVPFSEGQLLISEFDYYGLGESGWLRLDEGEDKRRGEFDASWFRGKFKAELCGEPSEEDGDDTGRR